MRDRIGVRMLVAACLLAAGLDLIAAVVASAQTGGGIRQPDHWIPFTATVEALEDDVVTNRYLEHHLNNGSVRHEHLPDDTIGGADRDRAGRRKTMQSMRNQRPSPTPVLRLSPTHFRQVPVSDPRLASIGGLDFPWSAYEDAGSGGPWRAQTIICPELNLLTLWARVPAGDVVRVYRVVAVKLGEPRPPRPEHGGRRRAASGGPRQSAVD